MRSLILLLTLTATTTAGAQLLTLDDAVAIALEQNPAQRVAIGIADAAQEQAEIARAARMPLVTADASYRRFQMHAFLPKQLTKQIPISVIGPADDFQAGVDVRYTLYDSGRRDADIDAARSGALAARADVASTRAQIVFGVEEAYFRMLAANAMAAAARARVERAEDHVRIAGIRKEAGAVPQIDIVRARVEVARARADLASATADENVARGALNTVLGRPAGTVVTVVAPRRTNDVPDADDATKTALANRAELVAQRERVALQRSLVIGAKSVYGPNVGVQGGYGFRDEELLPRDPEWAIGIGVEIALFDRTRSHRVAKATHELAREEARLAQLELAIQQEVWAAIANVREISAAVDASTAAMTEAEEALRLARARYDAGAAPINDLLDAEAALSQAQALRIATEYSAEVAAASVQRAVGR